MGNSISIFFLIEAVGTIAFASSGAMVAIRQNLDLLGIIVLGVTTAVGGGMMRDILLGIVPPSLFTNPVYTIMAFVTVLILFTVIRMNQHFLEGDCIVTYEKLMNYDELPREQSLEKAKNEAIELAVEAGAVRETVEIIEMEDVPLAYYPGNTNRVKIKAAGDLN